MRAVAAPRRSPIPGSVRTTSAVVAAAACSVGLRRWWEHRLSRRTAGAGPGIRTDDGVLLHVAGDGPTDGALMIVFAHGFAARSEVFEPQRASLSERVRVVTFDQRGHGRSGWGGHRGATIDRLGRDLGGIIDQWGPGSVIVVGHSLGGMAVMALADQRPELFGSKIVGVALLSTSAGELASSLPRPAAWFPEAPHLARAMLWLLWLVAPLVDRLAPLRRRWGRQLLRRQLFGSSPVPPPVVSKMQQMWTDTPRSVTAAFYPAMLAHDRIDAVRALDGVPTLVLAGSDDRTIPYRHSERLAAEAGHRTELVVLSGAGHMVNLTHPTAVNEALHRLVDAVLNDPT